MKQIKNPSDCPKGPGWIVIVFKEHVVEATDHISGAVYATPDIYVGTEVEATILVLGLETQSHAPPYRHTSYLVLRGEAVSVTTAFQVKLGG